MLAASTSCDNSSVRARDHIVEVEAEASRGKRSFGSKAHLWRDSETARLGLLGHDLSGTSADCLGLRLRMRGEALHSPGSPPPPLNRNTHLQDPDFDTSLYSPRQRSQHDTTTSAHAHRTLHLKPRLTQGGGSSDPPRKRQPCVSRTSFEKGIA